MESWQHIVELFILPPGSIVAFAFLGFLIQLKWRWLGMAMVALSVAVLTGMSLPLTGRQLTAALEASTSPLYADVLQEARKKAGAIIVLGAGRYADAPEYGADTVSRLALERLRYTARLHRQTNLPILVTGGATDSTERAEATLMRTTLQRDFQITPRWIEPQARNTMENAVYSRALLARAGIEQIILVTHAWHMRRALWSFQLAGFKVTPAPTAFNTLSRRERGLLGYLPSAEGLYWTRKALRERLGYQWYRFKYPPEVVIRMLRDLRRPAK
jgi:uncharacterized SAM-binding protein YcdF (DUF218 family)